MLIYILPRSLGLLEKVLSYTFPSVLKVFSLIAYSALLLFPFVFTHGVCGLEALPVFIDCRNKKCLTS